MNSVVNPLDGSHIELSSVVVLTDKMGTQTELAPASITSTEISVTVPGTLEPGNYKLQVMKASNGSNPMGMVVSPKVEIASVVTNGNGTITISGGGFSGYLDPVAGTSVDLTRVISFITGDTVTEACTVLSWSDTEITAQCPSTIGTAGVSSVFGTASKDLPPTFFRRVRR